LCRRWLAVNPRPKVLHSFTPGIAGRNRFDKEEKNMVFPSLWLSGENQKN
jgi:hypothetical protein